LFGEILRDLVLIDKINFQYSNLAGTKLNTENPEHGNFISSVINLYIIPFQPKEFEIRNKF